jgi:hypothetical protein
MGQANSPEDGEEPSAEESLPCLLGRDLDEGCSSEGDTTEVGKNVVCDDHGDGQNEPDEAFENVVDNEVRLSDDEEKGHMGPCELGELELVVALLKREDKKDETCRGQSYCVRVHQKGGLTDYVEHEGDKPVVGG